MFKNDTSGIWEFGRSVKWSCGAGLPAQADCIRSLDDSVKPEDLSPEEFSQIFFIARSVLYKYVAQWFLWRDGSLTDEMWRNRRRWAKSWVSLPVPARVWEMEKKQHQYAAGFIESIDSVSEKVSIGFGA